MNALSRISPLEREYEQAQQNFDRLTSYLDSEEALAMSHSELERELEKRGRELMRLLLQEHLGVNQRCWLTNLLIISSLNILKVLLINSRLLLFSVKEYGQLNPEANLLR